MDSSTEMRVRPMKAVKIDRFGGPEVMQIADLPVPEPHSGQVRVKVEAAGLNYADLMIRKGYYLGSYFPNDVDRVVTASRRLVDMLNAGRVRIVIGKRFPLDEAPLAFDYMEQRKNIGKVIITPS